MPLAPRCPAGRAVQLVKDATAGGAFGFLRTGVLDSVPMQVGCTGQADWLHSSRAVVVAIAVWHFIDAGSAHMWE